jgi:hypothetical protein
MLSKGKSAIPGEQSCKNQLKIASSKGCVARCETDPANLASASTGTTTISTPTTGTAPQPSGNGECTGEGVVDAINCESAGRDYCAGTNLLMRTGYDNAVLCQTAYSAKCQAACGA